ncbi:MAG: hypothetical protein M3680_11135 [Myxococcota bacterium]|nr:hypothetical protein [Myxococcota bacterium]
MQLMTSPSLLLVAALVAALAGCNSPRTPRADAFQRVAREANPILLTMKPAAAALLDAARLEESSTVIAACHSADESLRLLREVRFDGEYIDTPYPMTRVSDYAARLLDDRKLMCNLEDSTPDRVLRCTQWCWSTWRHLIDEVERLRTAASGHAVDMVSLRP